MTLTTAPTPTVVRAPRAAGPDGLPRTWWTTSWITPTGRGVQVRVWRERGHYRATASEATFRPDPIGGWFACATTSPDQHSWSPARTIIHSRARLAQVNAEVTANLTKTLRAAGRDDLLAILTEVERS